MASFTCNPCLQGSHRRCGGRDDCACSICATRSGRRSKPVSPSSTEETEYSEPSPEEETPKPISRSICEPAESPKEPSADPRAVYMRKYRQERRQGLLKPCKLSAETVAWAREQREAGRTYRSIATELEVDYSYLARRVKQG